MEESNNPVNSNKDHCQQGVVDQGKPERKRGIHKGKSQRVFLGKIIFQREKIAK